MVLELLDDKGDTKSIFSIAGNLLLIVLHNSTNSKSSFLRYSTKYLCRFRGKVQIFNSREFVQLNSIHRRSQSPVTVAGRTLHCCFTPLFKRLGLNGLAYAPARPKAGSKSLRCRSRSRSHH
ncbi:Uncharacterized protein Fot_06763 [Forsythia ovata]|uniref:Uncharacterized protein n=1 Tax=Forsythia ovata TaxID=205694 RepID=A0ABD1WU02_9LAMI